MSWILIFVVMYAGGFEFNIKTGKKETGEGELVIRSEFVVVI